MAHIRHLGPRHRSLIRHLEPTDFRTTKINTAGAYLLAGANIYTHTHTRGEKTHAYRLAHWKSINECVSTFAHYNAHAPIDTYYAVYTPTCHDIVSLLDMWCDATRVRTNHANAPRTHARMHVQTNTHACVRARTNHSINT